MSNFDNELLDNEMMQAYFDSLSLSNFTGSDLEDYIFLTDLMTKDMEMLIQLLPPEHRSFVEACYGTMHMYIDFSSKFYFKSGWKAAKEDNKLDHY